MNAINEVIQPSRLTLSYLCAELREGRYFVDNSFQRRLVWVDKQRVRLIETILMGYPMPEFYLWQQPVDTETGVQSHSIVDGQQRMNTIVQFVGNEWPLKEIYLDDGADYANKTWSELSDKNKNKFWNYLINVRTIPSDIQKDEITALFKRLNETDKSLNPQEIRNAEFDGLFLKASEEIADHPIMQNWEHNWRVFSATEKRRMADITFASSLLTYQRAGISNDTPANINKMYNLYNDKYDQKEGDLKAVEKTFKTINLVFEENDRIAQFFASSLNLYTLFVVIDQLEQEKMPLKKIQKKLLEFIEAYPEDAANADVLISEYRLGASNRTRSKQSRERRTESLFDWITQ